MIETGTFNLIYIMTMDDDKYRLIAMVAIRKATSCRVIELLDAFVANGTLEALVEILDAITEEKLQKIEDTPGPERTDEEANYREIQINCICIFI